MKQKFSEVLTIINGRNQKSVENPHGAYPIYGSGGVMGYADNYLCPGNTVIIGRKGNINKPIYVDKPFWNVDTAFGLQARETKLLPKYLFYFCQRYDFEKHNKTVTIPSLTKSDLLEIVIDIPEIDRQERICAELDIIESLICNRQKALLQLDELVKSRFVEMFGDPVTNSKGIDKVTGKDLFVFSSGQFLSADKRSTEGIPVYGGNGVAWYTEKPLINYPTIIIGRVGALCGNIHLVNIPAWITDNAIYIKQQKKEMNLTFMAHLMEWLNFHQYANYSGQPKITQKPLERTTYIYPPLEQQNQFADFVSITDKSKLAIQQSIDTLQTLKDKLMQDYFG